MILPKTVSLRKMSVRERFGENFRQIKISWPPKPLSYTLSRQLYGLFCTLAPSWFNWVCWQTFDLFTLANWCIWLYVFDSRTTLSPYVRAAASSTRPPDCSPVSLVRRLGVLFSRLTIFFACLHKLFAITDVPCGVYVWLLSILFQQDQARQNHPGRGLLTTQESKVKAEQWLRRWERYVGRRL